MKKVSASHSLRPRRLIYVGLVLFFTLALMASLLWSLETPLLLARTVSEEENLVAYYAISSGGANTPPCNQATPCDLYTAVSLANDGDSVHVAGGTYLLTGTLILADDNLLLGGFDQNAWGLPPNPELHETILDGGNTHRVIYIQNDASPTIEGFTIRNGLGVPFGGGIFNEGIGSPLIRNNKIHNNQASGASSRGGGIYDDGSAIIENNEIYANIANGIARGGGIYIGNLSPTATQVLFNEIYDNESFARGGGISVEGAAFIEGNDIHDNSAVDGAGLDVFLLVTATLQNNLFYQNEAASNGGGLSLFGGDTILWNNTIVSNTALINGAGIYVNAGATAAINNSIVAFNSGGGNDGIHVLLGGTATGDYNNIHDDAANAVFANLITADPLFINLATFNLHLRPTSPNRNTGNPATPGTVDQDIDREVRPNEGTVDIGADEFYAGTIAFEFIGLTPSGQLVDRGTDVTYTYQLENTGTISDSYDFACSNDRSWPQVSCPAPVIDLDPGLVVNVEAVFSVPPAETPLALATTIVTATSQSAPLTDTVAIVSQVRPFAGLQFEPDYNVALVPGEVMTFTHTLTNTGDSADIFNIDLVQGSWAELLPSNNFDLQLGLGESAVVQVRITVPPFAASGVINNTVIEATSFYGVNLSDQVTTTITALPTIGTRYIRTDGTDTDNNCTQANLPCQTLFHAVGQASTNDEIRVATGTYNEANTIVIPATIKITGGWNSNFTDQGVPDSTIIDMGNLTRAFRIITGSGNRPIISNLTIANGQSVTLGGAVIVEALARPRFESVIIRDSQATRGGAIYASNGAEVTLQKSWFLSNTAIIEGGAVFGQQATLSVNQSRFISNTADTASGGAIYANGSFVVAQNNLFHNNAAANHGGAWAVVNGQVTVGNDTMVGNTAVNNGAAFYNDGGNTSLRNTIVADSTSTGEAVYQNSGSTQLDFNDYWNNNPGGDANVGTGANSIFLEPTFADNVFHLALGSPAFDAGGFTTLDVDFEDDFRPTDQGFDIGYDELTGCRAQREDIVYGSIQAAVDAPPSVPPTGGDDLILVTGICRGVNNLDVSGNIISQTVRIITESLTIQGGWNNNFSEHDPALYPTFVDPEGRGRAFYIAGNIEVTIENLSAINGDATNLGGGPAGEDAGGAIYILDSIATVSATSILSSTADLGGALYNSLAALTVDGARIRVNSAANGGGLYNAGGQLLLVNSIFKENQAGTNGAAVYNAATGAVSILHNTFVTNTAAINGGGLYNVNGNATIRSNLFQGNQASSGPDIFVSASSPSLDYNYHYPNAIPVNVAIGPNSISSTTTPPGLVDVGNNDFHVFDNAPVVDAGDPASPVDHDFEGDLRPSNQASDIGADEVAGCLAQLNGIIYGSLQEAVNNAVAGDEILVSGRCTGVHQYDPGLASGCNDTGLVNTLLHIEVSVTLSGGWDETFANQNQVTELDALSLGRVVHIAPNITPTLDGFDILHGDMENGAGICIDNSMPTISHNRIYSHTATDGAAIYSLNSAALIDGGNHIYGNTATNGGALYVTGATVATVQNNFVYLNTADNGAAFYNASGNHEFWHNTIVNNTATSNGGGFYNETGSPVFHSNILVDNSALTGGGVFGAGGTPDLDYNNTFNNSGGDAAGTAVLGPNHLAADPELQPDYTILIGSPVVDKGDPTTSLAVDFEDDIRPSHQSFDIGADEVGGCFARIVGDPAGTIYGSVQLAANDASSGDTIEVDGICYGVNTAGVVTQNLFLNKNLTLDGDWDFMDEAPAVLDALGGGRVVYIVSGVTVTMTDFTLRNGNAGLGGLADNGGGVFNDGGSLNLISTNIANSTATNGGGLANQGTLALNLVHMFQNTAGNGGGFYMISGQATITNSRFYLNQASSDGGGLYHNSGLLFLNASRLYTNEAGDQGGAIYLTGGTGNPVDVRNNFIYENNANTAGGLYNDNTNVRVYHNTFVANNGGNLYSASGGPDIRNNIVDGVDNSHGFGIHIAAGVPQINYNNLFGNNPNYSGPANPGAGANDISISPLYINRTIDDYHLQDNSPGVDEGLSTLGVLDDIDGDIRPTNGDSDMGADEVGSCLIRVINPLNSEPTLFGVLQDAIESAESFGAPFPIVEIARGECKGVKSVGGSLQVGYITQDLTIIGSLRRTDFSDPDDPHNPLVNAVSTIINAEGNGRVLVIADNAQPTLVNMAFVNGNAFAGGGADNNGGAVRNGDNTLTTMLQTYSCASQAANGGGYYGGTSANAYISGGVLGACSPVQITEDENGDILAIEVLDFIGNQAANDGGGLYIGNGLEIVNLYLESNTAGGSGGGLYHASTASPVNLLINGIFYSNTAQLDGGAIFNNASGLSIYHNTIRDNVAVTGNGGGIQDSGTNLILNSSILYNNIAAGTGGGLNSASASLDYNNFFTNLPNDATVATGPNSISADPEFLFVWLFFHTSPNIDKADPALLPPLVQAALDRALQLERLVPVYTGMDSAEISQLVATAFAGQTEAKMPIPGAAVTSPPVGGTRGGAVMVEFDALLTDRPDGGTVHTGDRLSDIGAFEWYKDFGCAILPTPQNQTAVPGTTITYTFDVVNVGNPYPTLFNSNGYSDVITITLDSETNPWGTLLGEGTTPELAWFESVPITLVVDIPLTATSAIDTAVIRCRSTGVPTQTRTATAQTIVGLTSGVIVEPDYIDSALPGDVITYVHTITNIGNLPGEFEIVPNSGVLGLSVAEIVDSSGTVLISPTIVLDVDESTTALLRVTIVDTAEGGQTATPGLTARSTEDPLIQDAAINQILIGFIPGTRYVAVGGDDFGNNCTVATFPCATGQHAVDQALAGDAILVAGGTYNDVVTRTIGLATYTQTLFINKSVSIHGGYSTLDDFTTVQPITNAVTLSGENNRRVIYVAAGETVALSGLFIENGVAPSTIPPTGGDRGGGIYNAGTTLTISGTWVIANSAQFGGGIYHAGGPLNLYNTILAGNHNPNTQPGGGGGLYIADGPAVLANNTFVANTPVSSPPSGGTGGGAVYQNNGTLDLFNNIFADNAADTGSAVFISTTVAISTDYNLYDNNLPAPPTNFVTGTNSITGTLDFLDAFYHIGPTSAAKDTGTSSGAPAIDFELQPRPLPAGGLFDIGADERVQKPDFIFLPITQTATITPNDTVTYTHWLTNTGDVADSYTFTMTNQSLPPGGGWSYALAPTMTTVLNSGQFVSVTLVVTAGPIGGYVDVTSILASSVNFSPTRRVTDTTIISSTAGVDIEPSRAGSGGPTTMVQYTHTLTNTGTGIDQFFLQLVNGTPPTWTVTIVPTQTTFLLPGETAPVTVTVTIPAGTLAGEIHEVGVQAVAVAPDASDLVTDTTTVLAGYALSLTPNNTATVMGPVSVVYTHTLANLGNISDTVSLAVAAASGSPTWTMALTPTAVILEPLESTTVSVTVDVPAGAGVGVQHVAVVTATSSSPPPLSPPLGGMIGGVQATAFNTTTIGMVPGVLVTPSAQLVITAPGTLVTYEHTVINTGNISDTFTLTATSSQGWLYNFTGGPLPSLQPGESVTVTIMISVPVGATPGQQDDTIVIATSSLDPAVFDSATDTTRVQQDHALLFFPDNTRIVPSPSVVVYTHTLTNIGTGPDTFAFSATSSQSWTVQLPPQLPLAAGDSATVMVTLTVPVGSEGLTDIMEVTAVSIIEPTAVATVTNTTIVTDVLGVAGVIIEPDWTRTAVPNQVVLYTHTVTNTGTFTDSYALNVVSSLAWTVSVAPSSLLNVPPAASRMVTVTVNVPAGAAVGVTDMTTVTVASLTVVTATDTAVDTTEVLQLRSVLLEPNRTMTTSAGSTVTYTHYLTNTGNGADTFVVSAISNHGWTTQIVTPAAPVTLDPGAMTTVTVSLAVPLAGSGLTDTMIVQATSIFMTIVNDTVTDTTIVTGVPLALGVVIAPDNVSSGVPGAAVAYAHTVTNTGSVTDSFSLGAVSDQGWTVTGLPASPIMLAPNESAAINLSVAIPGTAVNGVQDLTTVTATSLTDNSVSDQALDRTTVIELPPTIYLPLIMKPSGTQPPPPVTPTPTPTPPIPPPVTPTPISCIATGVDLIVTQIQVVPNPPVAGQPVTVFVTIRNQGSQDVTFGNNFYVDFYVDRVPQPLLIGDLYAGIQGADMTAGSSRTYVMDQPEASLPFSFTAGSHQLYAQVDTDNTVDECPLENNNILGPVTISVAGLGQDGESEERPDSSGPRQTPTPDILLQQPEAAATATPVWLPLPANRP